MLNYSIKISHCALGLVHINEDLFPCCLERQSTDYTNRQKIHNLEILFFFVSQTSIFSPIIYDY